MSEFEEWWRRTKRLFDEIDKLFDELIRESFEMGGGRRRRTFGPYYYGFSVTIGPDGVPRIREWGNIKPGVIRPRISEATETEVRISAERGDRKYFKTVKLPARVRPETAKAQYKNGVLTIVIEKAEKRKKPSGFRVKVE